MMLVQIMPVVYFAGLALLPRQLRQEKAARGQVDVPLNEYIRAPDVGEKAHRL